MSFTREGTGYGPAAIFTNSRGHCELMLAAAIYEEEDDGQCRTPARVEVRGEGINRSNDTIQDISGILSSL